MDDGSVTGRDLARVRAVLDITAPGRRPQPEDTADLLASLEQLLGCEATVCVVESGFQVTPTPGADSSQVLTITGEREDAGLCMHLVLRNTAPHPFSPSSAVLLDLLRPHLARWLCASAGRRTPAAERLTDRQLGILRLVQLGMSNREVARSLRITEATVRKHLENAFQRLGVLSRSAAVAAAFESTATTDRKGDGHGRHLRQLA